MMKIVELNYYPVKSMCGITLQQAPFTPMGMVHDREWLIAQNNGDFLTARQLPQLLHFHAEMVSGSLKICAPDGDTLWVHTKDYTQFAPIHVWKDHFGAWQGLAQTDEWLSEKLGQTVRLYWLGTKSERTLSSGMPLSFADGAPFLLTNCGSLAALSQILGETWDMTRFRANIVVDGVPAWEEETWRHIRIGTAEFEWLKPCKRCVLTTIDLPTLTRHPQQQPLAYLARERNAIFGINLITRTSGTLRVGDSITVLA